MSSAWRWSGGVIEGFYGRPWTVEERSQLFAWMSQCGLQTYFHAPKDDPHHRAIWREPLPAAEAAALCDRITACREQQIDLVFAIHPGLDIRHHSADDLRLLIARLEQVASLGGRDFAVLFDDISGVLSSEDAGQFASLAEAQAHVVNQIQAWLAQRVDGGRLLICPTAYCGRMSHAELGGTGYLAELGRRLDASIDVLWTGPEIISSRIDGEHLRSVGRLLRRPPVIWDNLFANDYDGERFFAGPFSGRSPDIAPLVRGVLLNPNNELPLNFVPLHTLGQFVRGGADSAEKWDPRQAYLTALAAWLPSFALLAGEAAAVTEAELRLLIDCFYLPHEHGDEAARLLQNITALCGREPSGWGDAEQDCLERVAALEQLAARLGDLRDRPLFHALSRRLWPLREELSLLRQRLLNRERQARGEPLVPDDDHLVGTFRGGFLAELRRHVPFPEPPTAARSPAAESPQRLPLLRKARLEDRHACYRICLETGDHGGDGRPYYTDDPEALGRVFVGPYLEFEPQLSFVLEDSQGVCGYVLATANTQEFFQQYENAWRPSLCRAFPQPTGDADSWTRAEQMHHEYHHPDYHAPEPTAWYPAHAHIDLLPRVQGCGFGAPMMRHILAELTALGVAGVHLGVSGRNQRALRFYARLGFVELERTGRPGEEVIYLGLRLPQHREQTA